MATQTGSYDFAPVADAAGKANNYITDLGNNGIRVHPLGDTDNYSAIDANGMSVVKGGTSVAHFGETARIGVESAFNTLIQAAQFAIRYATDRLFNISTDGHSTNIYMGGSTLPSGFKYTDNQVFTIYDYLTGGCTVSGHVVLAPDGTDTTWRLSEDGYGYLYDAAGTLIIGPGTGEIEYLPSTGTWEVNPSLSPQSEIPGAPVSIDMGNVGIRAANKKLAIVAAGVAEGSGTTASGSNSHAEGSYTTANGTCSHAEGARTTATKAYSHTEGYNTTASGTSSHAEGSDTSASGIGSHAEGVYTTASSDYSHAQNQGTTAGYPNQTVIGRYNDNGYSAFEIGNGTSDSTRSNALTVAWDGTVTAAGEVKGASVSATVSLASGVTADTHAVMRSGKMVTVYVVGLNLAAELANHGSATVGTVPTGYRPAYTAYGQLAGYNDGGSYVSIGTNGAVTVSNQSGAAIPTARELGFTVTYVM